MERKGGGEIILVKKYQPNWIWTILVKPVYRQASSKLFFLFAVGFFGGEGCWVFLIKKPRN